MRIKIIAPCTTPPLNLQPGDVIEVKTLTPELQRLLDSRRMDDSAVAELVRGNPRETATTRPPSTEKAIA